MAAHKLGQVEAYLTVREALSELSTAADGVLSRERSGFYRCRYATLGLIVLMAKTTLQQNGKRIGNDDIALEREEQYQSHEESSNCAGCQKKEATCLNRLPIVTHREYKITIPPSLSFLS